MTKKVVRIQQIGLPNKNNRIFLRDVLEKNVIQKEVELKKIEMPILGEIIQDPTGLTSRVNFNRVSHAIDGLRFEKGWLVGNLTVLNLPDGEILEKIMAQDEPSLCIRYTGEVTKALLNGCREVTGLEMLAIDVLAPATRW